MQFSSWTKDNYYQIVITCLPELVDTVERKNILIQSYLSDSQLH